MAEANGPRKLHLYGALASERASNVATLPPTGPKGVRKLLVFGLLCIMGAAIGTVFFVRPTTVTEPVAVVFTGGDVYPTGVVIDVKQYGAVGDGKTDDTRAVQSAISHNVGDHLARTLFFPAGTYLVSDRLEWRDTKGRWGAFLSLQGEDRDSTTIKLIDGASGYGDPEKQRALIFTASESIRTRPDAGDLNWRGLGEGNEAFRNSIFDLTVDTGSRNPGAIAIDYLANNVGAIRNVDVISGDGQGAIGIGMVRQWPGPALLQDVSITGFDYGIRVRYAEYGMTFENVTLKDQRKAGIRNEGNVLSIHNLTSDNSVPALENVRDGGLITLVGGAFAGGASKESAIWNTAGEIYARDVTTTGYGSALRQRGSVVPGVDISEYASSSLGRASLSTRGSDPLPILSAPALTFDPPANWVNVEDFGAYGRRPSGADDYGDDASAIQAAIDSGARTIYLPRGRYLINDTVQIRGNVERIVFAWSWVGIGANNNFGDGRPLFSVEDGSSPVVMLDQLGPYWQTTSQTAPTMIDQRSSRALILRDSSLSGYRNTPGSGPLFLENVVGSPWLFRDQDIWARQFNVEGDEQPKIRSQGSRLWVLGFKTELPSTAIEAADDGRTEVFGGLLYPVHDVSSDTPAFSFSSGTYTLSYAVSAYDTRQNYGTQINDTQERPARVLDMASVLERGHGSIVPLFTSESWRVSPASTLVSAAGMASPAHTTPAAGPSQTPSSSGSDR